MSEHVEEPAEAGELNYEEESEFDALVIGAGAAGVGAAIALIHAGIGNFAVLTVGSRCVICCVARGNPLYHAILPDQLHRHGRYQLNRTWRISWVQSPA